MKRVLVTGGAGFLGRHFIAELQRRTGEYSQIISVDLETAEVDVDFAKVAHGHVIDDLLKFLWRGRGRDMHYDLIIHCAAVAPHRRGIDENKASMIANMALDAELFHWAVTARQGRILYISSSAVYPACFQTPEHLELCNGETALLEEADQWIDDPGNPFDDYGWVKLMGEKMADNARECGLPVTVVRPFSGYGEDQTLDFPFPAILDRARDGNLTVWGPPGQTRDWIHVDDIVAGSLAIAESGTDFPVNLCTGVGTEMGGLAQMMGDAAKEQGLPYLGPVIYNEDAPTGVFYRVGDPERMLQYYTPRVGLEEGIRRSLAWATK